jgi:hypothetical protein
LHTATGDSLAGSELWGASHGNAVGGGVSSGPLAYASGSVSHTVTSRPTATDTVRLPTPTVVPSPRDETQPLRSELRGPFDPLATQPAQPATSTPTATTTTKVFTQTQTPPAAVEFHGLPDAEATTRPAVNAAKWFGLLWEWEIRVDHSEHNGVYATIQLPTVVGASLVGGHGMLWERR